MPQDDIPTSIVDKSARHTLEWKMGFFAQRPEKV
jgi:hypothetical protein